MRLHLAQTAIHRGQHFQSEIFSRPLAQFATVDLLQKSFMEIGNGRDEAESESKAFSSISVSAAQDAKALECSQDVFDANAA